MQTFGEVNTRTSSVEVERSGMIIDNKVISYWKLVEFRNYERFFSLLTAFQVSSLIFWCQAALASKKIYFPSVQAETGNLPIVVCLVCSLFSSSKRTYQRVVVRVLMISKAFPPRNTSERHTSNRLRENGSASRAAWDQNVLRLSSVSIWHTNKAQINFKPFYDCFCLEDFLMSTRKRKN